MIHFRSFFIGGFECADHINRSGERVDMLAETGHSMLVREDYRLLSEVGIYSVREGISWSRVESQPYEYDFSEVSLRIEAAIEFGIEQVWDICHFGYPDGLIPTHPKFTDRFAALCGAFTQFYRELTQSAPIIIPINEISFLSWHSGEVRGTVPFAIHSGFDIKYHLCKAAIKGIETILNTDPEAHIMLVEPLICIHPSATCHSDEILQLNEEQFQAMDIISGRICPELGGKPEYLQILGFNYYHNNQWVHNGPILCWQNDHARRENLSLLLKKAYTRYGVPVVLSETGHFGADKCEWIKHITGECKEAMNSGVDLRGICIYPVIDRPDWDDLSLFCNCGIWETDIYKNRITDKAYQTTIKQCHEDIKSIINHYSTQSTPIVSFT